ncbi:MAG: DUF2493 domain-containing protein [Clostridia bacterium]|nr:DUF2493 domain-containing protein [Clostridia bacterium]
MIEIIGGGANGADRFGEEYALMRGLPYRLFLPDWKKYKRGAGIVRNREMAQYSSEEIGVLFAFWDGKSKGTKNMIQTAKRLGLNVYVVDI